MKKSVLEQIEQLSTKISYHVKISGDIVTMSGHVSSVTCFPTGYESSLSFKTKESDDIIVFKKQTDKYSDVTMELNICSVDDRIELLNDLADVIIKDHTDSYKIISGENRLYLSFIISSDSDLFEDIMIKYNIKCYNP